MQCCASGGCPFLGLTLTSSDLKGSFLSVVLIIFYLNIKLPIAFAFNLTQAWTDAIKNSTELRHMQSHSCRSRCAIKNCHSCNSRFHSSYISQISYILVRSKTSVLLEGSGGSGMSALKTNASMLSCSKKKVFKVHNFVTKKENKKENNWSTNPNFTSKSSLYFS